MKFNTTAIAAVVAITMLSPLAEAGFGTRNSSSKSGVSISRGYQRSDTTAKIRQYDSAPKPSYTAPAKPAPSYQPQTSPSFGGYSGSSSRSYSGTSPQYNTSPQRAPQAPSGSKYSGAAVAGAAVAGAVVGAIAHDALTDDNSQRQYSTQQGSQYSNQPSPQYDQSNDAQGVVVPSPRTQNYQSGMPVPSNTMPSPNNNSSSLLWFILGGALLGTAGYFMFKSSTSTPRRTLDASGINTMGSTSSGAIGGSPALAKQEAELVSTAAHFYRDVQSAINKGDLDRMAQLLAPEFFSDMEEELREWDKDVNYRVLSIEHRVFDVEKDQAGNIIGSIHYKGTERYQGEVQDFNVQWNMKYSSVYGWQLIGFNEV